MSECKCTFAKKTTGDGCEVCNPAKALEYAKEEIERLTAERDALKKALSYLLEHQLYINSHAKAVIKCALEKSK